MKVYYLIIDKFCFSCISCFAWGSDRQPSFLNSYLTAHRQVWAVSRDRFHSPYACDCVFNLNFRWKCHRKPGKIVVLLSPAEDTVWIWPGNIDSIDSPLPAEMLKVLTKVALCYLLKYLFKNSVINTYHQ